MTVFETKTYGYDVMHIVKVTTLVENYVACTTSEASHTLELKQRLWRNKNERE